MGLPVSQPFGDNQAYDFITDHNGLLKRVQVKGITYRYEQDDSYRFHAVRGNNVKTQYTKEDVDVIAAYVFECNAWYLIDIKDLRSTTVRLYPHRYNAKGFYEDAHERWNKLYE